MLTTQAYAVIVAGVLLIPLYEFDLPPITTVYDFGKAQRGTTDVFYKQMSTKAENGLQPITVEVLRGAEATDPQVAIWIEDESGTLLSTLYVSSALATNNFFAIDGSTPRRPEALPIWSHRRGVKAADGLYAPDDETQLADGVTAATPNTNFILSSVSTRRAIRASELCSRLTHPSTGTRRITKTPILMILFTQVLAP